MSLSEDFKNKKEEITEGIENKKNEIVSGIQDTKKGITESIDSGVKKTVRFTKRLFMFTLLGAILGTGVWLYWCNMTYSDGTRTGYLSIQGKQRES